MRLRARHAIALFAASIGIVSLCAGAAVARPSSSPPGKPFKSPSPTPTTSTTSTSATASPTPTATSTTSTSATASPTPTVTSTTATTSTSATASPTPTATSSSTSPPSLSCGSAQLVKTDGSAWTCTFDDEFDGTALNTSNWAVQTTAASGFTTGTECFVNSPNNVSVGNGLLSLTIRKEAAPFTCGDPSGNFTSQYTSGEVLTYGKFSQAYGRFEVRASFPATTVAGLQEALWLWPNNSLKYGAWPASGEIDIAEVYSQHADRAIPYVHYVPSFYDYDVTNNYCLITNVNALHNYVVEWTTSTITVSYDGQTCTTDTWNPASPLVKPQPFDQPFMIALTQGLGQGSNAFDPATTPLPATTQIDYVRAWK
jgi:beta-glucanase (GH16 family)